MMELSRSLINRGVEVISDNHGQGPWQCDLACSARQSQPSKIIDYWFSIAVGVIFPLRIWGKCHTSVTARDFFLNFGRSLALIRTARTVAEESLRVVPGLADAVVEAGVGGAGVRAEERLAERPGERRRALTRVRRRDRSNQNHDAPPAVPARCRYKQESLDVRRGVLFLTYFEQGPKTAFLLACTGKTFRN